jgi:signal peptidase
MSLTIAIPTTGAAAETKPKAERPAWKFYVDVLSTIMTLVIVMVAAVAIVLAVATRLSPQSKYGQYRAFSHPVLIVLSGSMAPAIHTGDLIVDNPVNATQAQHLKVGQIITFTDSPSSKTVITHRIVGITNVNGSVAYLTKGDANNGSDTAARPAADVLGTFAYAIPRGGYLLNSMHRPMVLGLLLISPILWFIAGPLFKAARKMDEQEGREPVAPAGGNEAGES